jgi:hypothetical protein
MAKIVRKTQKIFASTPGTNQIAQVGSLAAGTPTFSTDPDVIQQLTNFLQGWFACVVGANSPAIEDMNALQFLFSRQIAYLMQEGVAEWDAGTTYYIGSLVQDSNGLVYCSVANNNTNNALATAGFWSPAFGRATSTPAPLGATVVTGESLMIPNLSLGSTQNYAVQAGASLISFNSLTVASGGSLTVAPGGQARVI